MTKKPNVLVFGLQKEIRDAWQKNNSYTKRTEQDGLDPRAFLLTVNQGKGIDSQIQMFTKDHLVRLVFRIPQECPVVQNVQAFPWVQGRLDLLATLYMLERD